ncbi:MAG: type II secretion system protein GspC [Gammaproteobacteria bacterium]|nr:type II secretion system protein GspC [Gammaproteobacteria bacterium]
MRPLISFTIVVLTFACGIASAHLTWRMVAPPVEAMAMVVPVNESLLLAAGSGAVKRDSGQQRIANRDLFGVESTPKLPEQMVIPVAESEAPLTQLKLTLNGVFFSQDKASYALIAKEREDALPYHIGSEVAAGTELHSIYPDYVMLLRSGVLERLELESLREGGDRNASRRTPPPTRASAAPEPPQPQVTTRYGEIRSRLLNNPQDAIRMAKIRPLMENGKMRGYRVNPGRGENRQLFDELGFIPGDVVTAVNGVSVIDPTQIGAVMNALTAADTVTVTLERNGAIETLSVTF